MFLLSYFALNREIHRGKEQTDNFYEYQSKYRGYHTGTLRFVTTPCLIDINCKVAACYIANLYKWDLITIVSDSVHLIHGLQHLEFLNP